MSSQNSVIQLVLGLTMFLLVAGAYAGLRSSPPVRDCEAPASFKSPELVWAVQLYA